MEETGRFAAVDVSRVLACHDVSLVIQAMADDLREHPGAWENSTLDRFLEALGAWLEDREPQDGEPSWRLFAEALVAASGYE